MTTVQTLVRYPVKSMLGEEATSAELVESGVRGDRGWALHDLASGLIASAKSPRLWRSLLTMSAHHDGDGVRIELPDGRHVRSGDSDAGDVLSEAVGRRVELTDVRPEGARLARAVPDQVLAEGLTAVVDDEDIVLGEGSPAATFVDFAPVHLVGTATLAALAAAGSRGVMEPARCRPNLVLDTDGPAFGENAWIGRDLTVGAAVLRVFAATPRCSVPTLNHGDLPRDPEALRIPAQRNLVPPAPELDARPCVGVYAHIVRPGRVRLGDAVDVA